MPNSIPTGDILSLFGGGRKVNKYVDIVGPTGGGRGRARGPKRAGGYASGNTKNKNGVGARGGLKGGGKKNGSGRAVVKKGIKFPGT